MELNLDLTEDFYNSSDILFVLGSPTRLKILKYLSEDKDYTINDIAKRMRCGISNVSQQIKMLQAAGLIRKIKTKDGTCAKIVKPMYDKLEVKLV